MGCSGLVEAWLCPFVVDKRYSLPTKYRCLLKKVAFHYILIQRDRKKSLFHFCIVGRIDLFTSSSIYISWNDNLLKIDTPATSISECLSQILRSDSFAVLQCCVLFTDKLVIEQFLKDSIIIWVELAIIALPSVITESAFWKM